MPAKKAARKNIDIVKKGDIEVRIIRDLCIGAATCIVYAPSTFDLDEDNIAIAKNGEWDRLEKIIAAAQSCPVVAIEVFQKGKKVYPK
ncbi:ferredoxin [Candidatus Microgenomates bacterium]|nr:ferredoxin [Candidatus Microgenomates bacterium]